MEAYSTIESRTANVNLILFPQKYHFGYQTGYHRNVPENYAYSRF